MKLELLHIPDCPNVPILERRLQLALSGAALDVEIVRRVVDQPDQAAAAGMTGSPTLLINGHDPFETPGQVPSLSCRLYPSDSGKLDRAPSVAAIRNAVHLSSPETSNDGPLSLSTTPTDDVGRASCCSPSGESESSAAEGESSAAEGEPSLAEGELSSAQGKSWVEALTDWRGQPTDSAEKAVHHVILRSFATRGRPPAAEELTATVRDYAVSTHQVLRQLHNADIIRLDPSGEIASAYPFSTVPTPHRIQITGGATAHAMCAIDALGLAVMLDADITVTSADPATAEPITVTITDQRPTAQPAGTVVFVGGADAEGPFVDTCCNYLNFFSNQTVAQAWADAHPNIGGVVLSLDEAYQLGDRIFGHLLVDT
jgi:hypothetical protein